jgi:hypothetical protein
MIVQSICTDASGNQPDVKKLRIHSGANMLACPIKKRDHNSINCRDPAQKPDVAFRDILNGRNPCSKLTELIKQMAAMVA